MNRVTVIGADGQLGSDLVARMQLEPQRYSVEALTIDDLDITNRSALKERIERSQPDFVINTAAYHAVDACEENVESAYEVNVIAPHHLARACARFGTVLVQFSSDYVFDGRAHEPYDEDSRPSPQSVYAASRLAGEHAVRIGCPRHFIVRTCGLYGLAGRREQGASFVEIMLRLAAQGRTIRVVDDQHVGPTFTKDLAAKLLELFETQAFGLYHLTNGGQCTWYELALAVFRLAGVQPPVEPVSSAEYGAAAARPAYSILENRNLKRLGLAPLRNWEEALAEYMRLRVEAEE